MNILSPKISEDHWPDNPTGKFLWEHGCLRRLVKLLSTDNYDQFDISYMRGNLPKKIRLLELLVPYVGKEISYSLYWELILQEGDLLLSRFFGYIPYDPQITDPLLASQYMKYRKVADQTTVQSAFIYSLQKKPPEMPPWWEKIPIKLRLAVFRELGSCHIVPLFGTLLLQNLVEDTILLGRDEHGLVYFVHQFILSGMRWKLEYQIIFHQYAFTKYKLSPEIQQELVEFHLNHFMPSFTTDEQIYIWQQTPYPNLSLFQKLDWKIMRAMRPPHQAMTAELVDILLDHENLYDYTDTFTEHILETGNSDLFKKACQIPDFICRIYQILDHNHILEILSTNKIILPSCNEIIDILPDSHRQKYEELGLLTLHECPICLSVLDKNVIQTPCRHKFHHNCLLMWLAKSAHCPCCRRLVPIERAELFL